MFLILCETGVRHFEGRGPKWVEVKEDMTPGNYIYLSWNFDHLFTTADGKSIQLKVVDGRPASTQQRSAYKRELRMSSLIQKLGSMGDEHEEVFQMEV
jgi:hypothetical protein